MPNIAISQRIVMQHPQVAAVLHDSAEPLSGYPVMPLVEGCCDATDPEQRVRAWRLLDAVIGRWIQSIDEDIRSLKPGARPALQRMEQRSRDTFEALQRLQRVIRPLTLDPQETAEPQ
jgi:hypothetical protein